MVGRIIRFFRKIFTYKKRIKIARDGKLFYEKYIEGELSIFIILPNGTEYTYDNARIYGPDKIDSEGREKHVLESFYRYAYC